MTPSYKGHGRPLCQSFRGRAICPGTSPDRATCYVNASVRDVLLYYDSQRDGVTRPAPFAASSRNVWAAAPIDVPLPPPSQVVYAM